ncbi:hypothetical protein ACIQZO_17445 [Streptomyces sp. NPDC097617]|uniref:hypothetical protein n=1 Tax=Streptomyces sp. NPDC097617 TaxID=3366091 RepID=UPI003818BF75
MTLHLRTRRLALLVASTAVAAGGVLVPTTAFAATPAAPHVVDGGQPWQCFAAPCETPGGRHDGKWDHHDKKNHHDKWNGHDKWNHHDKKDHRDKWEWSENWSD